MLDHVLNEGQKLRDFARIQVFRKEDGEEHFEVEHSQQEGIHFAPFRPFITYEQLEEVRLLMLQLLINAGQLENHVVVLQEVNLVLPRLSFLDFHLVRNIPEKLTDFFQIS